MQSQGLEMSSPASDSEFPGVWQIRQLGVELSMPLILRHSMEKGCVKRINYTFRFTTFYDWFRKSFPLITISYRTKTNDLAMLVF